MVFFKTDTHPSDGQLIRHSRQKEESAGVKSRAADQASPTLDEVVRLTLTSANPAFTTDTPRRGADKRQGQLGQTSTCGQREKGRPYWPA